MGRTAVMFPGQGAQSVGMGRDVAEAFPAARRTFAEANDLLGFDLASLCFDGPAERLEATDVCQPAIFVVSVAVWRALEASGQTFDPAPGAAAGLSLGEYTALWLAGSLTFSDALTLVRERGSLMQSAAERVGSGMVSVTGLSVQEVESLCLDAGGGDVLSIANFNCPGQIVISGTIESCNRALALCEQRGGRATALRVAGGFHSKLMEPAAEGLRAALARVKVSGPRIPVVSNVTADYHRGPESIRQTLHEQLVRPVRWQASMERLIAEGFDRFVEVGPGRVLTGMMRRINRAVRAENYSSAEALGCVRT